MFPKCLFHLTKQPPLKRETLQGLTMPEGITHSAATVPILTSSLPTIYTLSFVTAVGEVLCTVLLFLWISLGHGSTGREHK